LEASINKSHVSDAY